MINHKDGNVVLAAQEHQAGAQPIYKPENTYIKMKIKTIKYRYLSSRYRTIPIRCLVAATSVADPAIFFTLIQILFYTSMRIRIQFRIPHRIPNLFYIDLRAGRVTSEKTKATAKK